MSRKRLLIIVITIVCMLLILIASYYATTNIPKGTDDNQSSNNSPQETSPESLVDSPESLQGSPNPSTSPSLDNTQNETPHNTTFVVPESPFGTIGVIASIATALGIFATKQRRKASP